MQIIASKFIYPEDERNLGKVLSPFQGLAIQLSFFKRADFLKMNHNLIWEICASFNVKISTVHAPTVDVFHSEFLSIIEKIKKTYGVNIVTIHPQKGDISFALAKLEEYNKIFEELDIILAYENFPSFYGKRKWIYSAYDMHLKFNLPFLKITFDTSHLDKPQDCIKEFDLVFHKIAIVHLSDCDGRREHQPLGDGCVPYKEFLEHLEKIGFEGFVVLEYMPEHELRVIEDVKRLGGLLESG